MDDSKLLRFGAGVPLIKNERSWKGMSMAINPVDPQEYWQPTGQIVAQAFPHGLFVVIVMATRSDDMPCKVVMPASGPALRDPEKLNGMLQGGWHLLNSYRDCDCTPTQACRAHMQAVNMTQEGGGDAGDEPAAGSDARNSGPAKLH